MPGWQLPKGLAESVAAITYVNSWALKSPAYDQEQWIRQQGRPESQKQHRF